MSDFKLGYENAKKNVLRDNFIEPPFSVLDTKSGNWQKRKRAWAQLGIKSEVGRGKNLTFTGAAASINFYKVKEGKAKKSTEMGTSIFDPALCEVLYKWFLPEKGTILDPFAGGSVRGIVAAYMGHSYTGIDIRPEQIESNIEQGQEIVPENVPTWLCGDSNKVLKEVEGEFDLVFTCPPYADLEVYSEIPGDISNMKYPEFLEFFYRIMKKSCMKLKSGGFAIIVVGEVRDKKTGNYYGFVPDTVKLMQRAGVDYYNEGILLNMIASASMRANKTILNKKLTKVHQNVLIFRKP